MIVKADSKKEARLNVMRDILSGYSYPGKVTGLTKPDRAIVFAWSRAAQKKLAP